MKQIILILSIIALPIIGKSQTIKSLKNGVNTIIVHPAGKLNDTSLLKACTDAIFVGGYDIESADKASLTTRTKKEPIGGTYRAFYSIIKTSGGVAYIQSFITDNTNVIGVIHKDDKVCKWSNTPSIQRVGFEKAIDMAKMIKDKLGGTVEFRKIKKATRK